MSGSRTFQSLTREALEQHGQIHFYLDQIELTLESLGTGPGEDADGVEPMRRLAAQVDGFKERLVEHHQAEETGGLFQAILDILPDCRVEISRLVNQHGRLIEILEMARIHAQCAEPSQAGELASDLRQFLEEFRQHERDEERLILRALQTETRLG